MKSKSSYNFRLSQRLLRLLLILMISLPFYLGGAGLSDACAQDDGAARLEAIRKQMDRGQGLFLAKKYEEAAAVFEEGYKTYPYSAFLFNAGVCYQKTDQANQALDAFARYLKSDPNAPDAEAVRARVRSIEEALAAAEKAAEAEPALEEGETEKAADPVKLPEDETGMKSLVLVETEPSGAPVTVFRRVNEHAPAYKDGAKNSLWKKVAEDVAPLNLTLDVGRYHVVVEEFQDFNRSEADIDVAPGHVHHFKANLSQGEFMGFVEIAANIKGARIYLDGSRESIWGETPHGALIAPGAHHFLIEAPGYESVEREVEIATSDRQTLEIEMKRVNFGVLRLDADVAEVTVSIDQKPAGVWQRGQSALEVELPAGKHELVVTASGYKQLRKSVVVPPGQVLPVRAKMIKKYPRGKAWTQAVLSAGLIGAGIYFGVESNRLDKELTADRAAGYLNSSDPRLNRGLWYSVGADSAFALGGILGILSTYNFIKDPYPDPVLYQGKQSDFKKRRQPEVSQKPSADPPPRPTPESSRAMVPWSADFAATRSVGETY